MSVLDAKDILAIAVERAAALNTYWNLFIGVASACIGVMASGKAFTGSRPLKVFLLLAFVLFALANLDAMLKLGDFRNALLSMLPQELPQRSNIVESLRPAQPWQYIVFHLVLDALVVSAIWFVKWPAPEGNNPAAGGD